MFIKKVIYETYYLDDCRANLREWLLWSFKIFELVFAAYYEIHISSERKSAGIDQIECLYVWHQAYNATLRKDLRAVDEPQAKDSW